MAEGVADSWRKDYQKGLELCASDEPDFSEAARRFSRAAQSAPDRWEPLYARAWCRLRNSDSGRKALAGVEQDLERVIELAGPHCPDAYAQLAVLRHHAGDHNAAVEYSLIAFGRVSSVPLEPGGNPTSDWVEYTLIDSLCAVLTEIDNAPATNAAFDRCAILQASLDAASLPPTLGRALNAEVLATRYQLHKRLDQEQEAATSLAALAAIAPEHPLSQSRPCGSTESVRSMSALTEPTFDDVGGIDVEESFQAKMRAMFESFFGSGDLNEMRRTADAMGERLLRTVLMFGPSGCGKTYIVHALAGEYRRRYGRELSIVKLRLNEIFSRYVGDSEKALTERFDQATRMQPSLLFIDELDAIGGSRDSGQDWRATQTSHLLQEIDRLQEANAAVLLIGSTNRLWQVELALLRRFDQLLPVEMPNSQVRRQIIRTQINRITPEFRPAENDLDLDSLVSMSHGLTAGDLANIMRKAKDRMHSDGRLRCLRQADIEASLVEAGKPLHVRTWVRSAIEALHKADLDEQADDLRDKYAGYLDQPIQEAGQISADTPAPLHPDAWSDTPNFDLRIVQLFGRMPQ